MNIPESRSGQLVRRLLSLDPDHLAEMLGTLHPADLAIAWGNMTPNQCTEVWIRYRIGRARRHYETEHPRRRA
jgi:hypothetical protein